MRIRGSFGIIVLAAGLIYFVGCGDDNEGQFGTATPTVAGPPTTVPTITRTSGPPGTSTPTIPVTSTNTPGATNTPGTPSPTVPGGIFCGNSVVETGEECDCGAVCLKGDGDKVGTECLSDEDCGSGGDCRPVGGQPVETEQSGEQPGACAPDQNGPCAANCTKEVAVVSPFANTCNSGTVGAACDPKQANQCGKTCAAGACGCLGGTGSRVQLTLGPLFLPIQGSQTFRVGKARSDPVFGPPDSTGTPKTLFNPLDIPLAVRATDFNFQKIIVPTLSCACVRAFPLTEFGPGLAGTGVVACGDLGLENTDYTQLVNHNTGIIPDDQCKAQPGQGTTRVNGTEIGGGTCMSQAQPPPDATGVCEGPSSGGVTWQVGDPCDANSECNDPHPTICNYVQAPPTFTGNGPKGASVLRTFTSVSSISDGGQCTNNPDIFDNGPDGEPCTDDDRRQIEPLIQFTTTGTATATVMNANPRAANPTVPSGVVIGTGSKTTCTSNTQCTIAGERCFNVANLAQACAAGQTCECRIACGAQACVTTISGQLYDCDTLMTNLGQGLTTGKTVISFGALHSAAGLDLVATTTFAFTPPVSSSSADEP